MAHGRQMVRALASVGLALATLILVMLSLDEAQALGPAIAISKASDPVVLSGSSATFTITVQNTGDVTLTNVTVTDALAPACASVLGQFAPGELQTYQCSSGVLVDDLTNSATVTGTPSLGGDDVGATDTADVDVIHPSLEISKTPDTQTVVAGSSAVFAITVQNTGDVTLTNVTVSDALVPACDKAIGILLSGQSDTYQCTTGALGGGLTNSATVTGTPPVGPAVSDTDAASVSVVNPAIEIAKSPDMQTVAPGSDATFEIAVRNTGDVALTDVVVSDALVPSCDKAIGTLDPDESHSYQCTLDDVQDGLINSAVVTGTVWDVGADVSDADAAKVRLADALSCPTDMIAYWKLDEIGGPAYDDFYNGHDAECAGTCPSATAEGRINGGQVFSSALHTKVDVPAVPGDDSFDWGVDEGFSIELWAKTYSGNTCSTNQVLIGRFSLGTAWWVGCEESSGAAAFYLESDDGHEVYVTGDPVNDGDWHHIVAVRDADTDEIRLYVDGVAGSEPAIYESGFVSAAELNIGWLDVGAGHYFAGIIDEVALYGTSLSADEVRQHRNEGLADRWYCQTGQYGPVIVSTPVTEAFSGRLYVYDVEAAGDPVPMYALGSTHPTGMTIDPVTGLIEWEPTAAQEYQSYPVEVRAISAKGVDIQTFSITVSRGSFCPDDMMAYWKLDEESGTTYYDFSDGYDGTCTAGSCPVSTTGYVDGAQHFEGTDEVDVSADAAFDWGPNDSFSIEFWTWIDSGNSCTDNQVMIGRYSTGTAWWVGCEEDTGKAAFYLRSADNVGVLVTGGQITDDSWHHVVAVRDADADQIRIYVDTVPVAAVAVYAANFATTVPINIGWFDSAGGHHFDGIMDELAVYDRALTVDEIEGHHSEPEPYCISPGIEIAKQADPEVTYALEWVTYSYTVTNAGDASLHSLALIDDQCGAPGQTSGDSDGDSALDPDEIWSYECSMTVDQDIENMVIVTGTDFLGGTWSDTASASVDIIAPGIDIVKTSYPAAVHAGDPVVYTYTVTNTGDDPLLITGPTDDQCAPVEWVSGGDEGYSNSLHPDETWVYTCSMMVAEDITNTVTVTGTDSLGTAWQATDEAFVDVVSGSVQVVKVAESTLVYAGSAAVYTYTVSNAGDGLLADVYVSDNKCEPVTPVSKGDGDSFLAPQEVWTYTCSTILEVDTTNRVTVTAVDPAGGPASGWDELFVDTISPAIALDKAAYPTSVRSGETVTYTYTVTNPGDDPLSDVDVTDDQCDPVSLMSGDTDIDAVLDPGEIWVYTCWAVVEDDTTNTATVVGTDHLGMVWQDVDTATVHVEGFRLHLPLVLRQW